MDIFRGPFLCLLQWGLLPPEREVAPHGHAGVADSPADLASLCRCDEEAPRWERTLNFLPCCSKNAEGCRLNRSSGSCPPLDGLCPTLPGLALTSVLHSWAGVDRAAAHKGGSLLSPSASHTSRAHCKCFLAPRNSLSLSILMIKSIAKGEERSGLIFHEGKHKKFKLIQPKVSIQDADKP